MGPTAGSTLSWCAMAHQKSRSLKIRLRPPDEDALGAIAEKMKLDRASCIRFLVLEKARALGLLPSTADPSAIPVDVAELDVPPKPKAR